MGIKGKYVRIRDGNNILGVTQKEGKTGEETKIENFEKKQTDKGEWLLVDWHGSVNVGRGRRKNPRTDGPNKTCICKQNVNKNILMKKADVH